MNKSGLILRLALTIGFSAVFIGFISSQLFYKVTYKNTLDTAQADIAQIYITVSPSSSIAAYLSDKELANEVLNGLVSNNLIMAASFTTQDLNIATEKFTANYPHQSKFQIVSPFLKNEIIGEVVINHDITYISSRADTTALFVSNALFIQSIVVTSIAIFIAFYFITKPMITIVNTLHTIHPGTSKRLKTPQYHQHSELGNLVNDINALLARTEMQITDERKLRAEIELLEKRFRLLFENSISPIILMEPRGNILLYNKAFTQLLEKIDAPFKKNFGPMLAELFDDTSALEQSVKTAFFNDEIATGEYKLKAQVNNHSVWVQAVISSIRSDDLKSYYQVTLHDVSKKRRELEALSERADYDVLTKLANRAYTEKQLETLINTQTPFAFVLIDLNGFKQINDRYGHDAGDEILIHVATQMKKAVREGEITCRWGGDEFVLVFPNIEQDDITQVLTRLNQRIIKPYLLIQHEVKVNIGSSMGVSFYPNDSIKLQQVINFADQAMYAIKEESKTKGGRFISFASNVADDSSEQTNG